MKTCKKVFLIILTVVVIIALNLFLWNYITNYNKIMMIVISLFLSILFILAIVLWRSAEKINNDNNIVNINDYYKINNAKELWKISSIIWAAIYYFLSGLSILSSIIIIYIASSEVGQEENIVFYSILAIFFSVIVFILHPMEIAIGYRKAFKKMNICMIKFSNKMIGFEEVIQTLEECEDLIVI